MSLLALSGVLGWQWLTLPASPAPARALGLSAASATLGILGAARLLDLPPFRRGELWLLALKYLVWEFFISLPLVWIQSHLYFHAKALLLFRSNIRIFRRRKICRAANKVS